MINNFASTISNSDIALATKQVERIINKIAATLIHQSKEDAFELSRIVDDKIIPVIESLTESLSVHQQFSKDILGEANSIGEISGLFIENALNCIDDNTIGALAYLLTAFHLNYRNCKLFGYNGENLTIAYKVFIYGKSAVSEELIIAGGPDLSNTSRNAHSLAKCFSLEKWQYKSELTDIGFLRSLHKAIIIFSHAVLICHENGIDSLQSLNFFRCHVLSREYSNKARPPLDVEAEIALLNDVRTSQSLVENCGKIKKGLPAWTFTRYISKRAYNQHMTERFEDSADDENVFADRECSEDEYQKRLQYISENIEIADMSLLDKFSVVEIMILENLIADNIENAKAEYAKIAADYQ
jgi:hypothetical protein